MRPSRRLPSADRMSAAVASDLDARLRGDRAPARPFGEPRLLLRGNRARPTTWRRRSPSAARPKGTTVVAAAQTAGRGRLGRTWFSPPGAGSMSRSSAATRRAAPLLTLAGGVAVADGIRAATGLPVQIKWPNDVVVEGGAPARRRKLAGILAEGVDRRARACSTSSSGSASTCDPPAFPPELGGSRDVDRDRARPAAGRRRGARRNARRRSRALFERLAAGRAATRCSRGGARWRRRRSGAAGRVGHARRARGPAPRRASPTTARCSSASRDASSASSPASCGGVESPIANR